MGGREGTGVGGVRPRVAVLRRRREGTEREDQRKCSAKEHLWVASGEERRERLTRKSLDSE